MKNNNFSRSFGLEMLAQANTHKGLGRTEYSHHQVQAMKPEERWDFFSMVISWVSPRARKARKKG